MVEHTCHPLPQQQVAMESEERGHPIRLTQFPFFPLLTGKNPGVFLKVFVHGDALDWCRNGLQSSALPSKAILEVSLLPLSTGGHKTGNQEPRMRQVTITR